MRPQRRDFRFLCLPGSVPRVGFSTAAATADRPRSRADNERNILQRVTFIYLASYLLVGGFGLLLMPELTLRLLLSNGTYGHVMPRLVGVFMRSEEHTSELQSLR